MESRLIKTLITGTPIGGKTSLAEKLAGKLSEIGGVVNHDVDYTEEWKKHYPGKEEDFYLLQTPHGAEAESEDGISFKEFDLITLVVPRTLCYSKLLINRGLAWFKEGVVEKPYFKEPAPYSPKLIIPIARNLFYYFKKRREWASEDRERFKGTEIVEITPYFRKGKLTFAGEKELISEIKKKINQETD